MLSILAPLSPESITSLLESRLQMEPPGRKAAVIASFAQVAGLVSGRLGRDSLRLAMSEVGTPRDGDAPPVTARRATCKAVAEALAFQPGEQDAARAALPEGTTVVDAGGFGPARLWFQVQIDAFGESADPRQAAMVATARRELAEIDALLG